MDKILWLVVGANVLDFILHLAYVKIKGLRKVLSPILYILAALGAGPGILLSMIFFDRKARKETLMLRVFVIAMTLIELILFLSYRSFGFHELSFDLVGFIKDRPGVLCYLVFINVFTFLIFGIDKYLARKNKRRIKNVILLGFAMLGGSIGGMAAMKAFRHKTQKDYYKIGLPLMLAAQVVFLIFVINLFK